MLETRMEFLKQDVEQIKGRLQRTKAMNLPALFSIETEYRLAVLETELGFVEKLINRIHKDGRGSLKEWKKWHADKAPKKKAK